jgi:hypothetical protein
VSAPDAVSKALDLLTRAAHDRKAAGLRWPVLATARSDGGVDARMLVVRAFDRAALSLDLHTDARSAKAGQLAGDPRCTLVFFQARARIQLRLTGEATLHTSDSAAAEAFARVPEGARDAYRGAAPGAPLGGQTPRPDSAQPHFALIRVQLRTADWLDLSGQGHERWLIDFSQTPPAAQAVEP